MPSLARRLRTPAKLFALLALALHALASPRAASAFQATLCSSVTCSGPGKAPKLTNVSGAGLSHAEIVPIFWGSYWNTATSPSRGQMVGAIQAIVNGPYLGALSQYGGSTGATVGPARMVPVGPIYTGTKVAAPTCSDGSACTVGGSPCADGSACDVQGTAVNKTIDALIGSGEVPGPAQYTDMLYIVFVPPGDTQADWNGYSTCSSTCGSAYTGLGYHTAMVLAGDTNGLSHEIVEAMTSNVYDTNCTYVGSGNAANQIADLCGCYSETEMGSTGNPIVVSAYWSEADAGSGGCVIPEGWDGLWMYNFYNWTEVYSGTLRQVYAGEYGVVATDTNDNLVGVTGLSGTLGGPGAMFAVGNSSLLALAPDASSVWEYSSGSWTEIGGPATSVLSGGYKVATDFAGAPWVYDSGWTSAGSLGDQFLVNHAGIVALGTDHQSVWLDADGTSSGWTKIGGSASEIFVGRDHGIAETVLGASRDVSYYSGSGTTWYAQGGPGNSFAVTMDDFFFGLNPPRTGVFVSSDTGAPNPPWIEVGSSAGRLVERTDSGGGLYATGGVVY
jgi:hypothetical protein